MSEGKYIITEALRNIGEESLAKFSPEDQEKIKKMAKRFEGMYEVKEEKDEKDFL